MKQTSAAITAAERSLGADGRIVVRYSGTEPKVRVMVEAKRRADLRAALAPVLSALREEAVR
jgi:phosphoglucosamine mutase